MPSPSELLLNEIEANLGSALDAGYASGAAANDLYEAYVWSRVLAVAARSVFTVSYADPSGPVAGDFRLRQGPGVIYSATPFTFGVLTSVGRPTLEAHVGIAVRGRSGVSHEFDVAVLSKAAADRARAANVDPLWSDVIFQAECKLYSGALSLGLARNLRGLSADCRLRLTGGLVSNADEADSITSLLAHHGAYYRPAITPSAPTEVAKLDRAIRKRLLRWLKANPRVRPTPLSV